MSRKEYERQTTRPVASGVDRVTREVLEAAALTDRAMSARSGVHRKSISKWRRGERAPSVANLTALAESAGLEIIVRPRAGLAQ